MTSWPEEFAAQIKEALASGEERRILVATPAAAELGKRAAERLARSTGGDATLISFDVAPPVHTTLPDDVPPWRDHR
jgi:hypothetical protein